MTKSKKLRGLTVAALAATGLFAAQPAAADTIWINGFQAGDFTNAHTAQISFNGIDWHTGAAATPIVNSLEFLGGFNTTNKTTGETFQSFCVDIFHSFNFTGKSIDTLMPATIISLQAAVDLGRLFTAHGAEVDVPLGSTDANDLKNEAAFQLAVWEIVNERTEGYNLLSGDFSAKGGDVALAQSWLTELTKPSVSKYSAKIWTVDHKVSSVQDVVVFTPVPEPQTYAMMLVGLGLLGFSARRKNQNLG